MASQATSTLSDRLEANASSPLSGVRVLVVDDDADARELSAYVLRAHGADVVEAANARLAWELLLQREFDVLVSDIGMPHEDGYAFIRAVRDGAWRLPAVALTAYSFPSDERRALESGYQRHLPKPVDPERLTTVVAGLVGPPSGVRTSCPGTDGGRSSGNEA
jgi:CheY-like chemotaxis protein